MEAEIKNDSSYFWRIGDITLRAAQKSDAAAFRAHFSDSPAWIERAYDRIGFPPTAEAVENWLSDYAGAAAAPAGAPGGDARVFMIEGAGGEFLGFIDVWEADCRNGVFRTGIKMLEGQSGKGRATKAFKRVLDFYFYELRYQKCDVYIYDFNEASLRFHKKLGFAEEGRQRREYYSNGRFHDAVLLGLTIEAYKALTDGA